MPRTRWTPTRKEDVVLAVNNGQITRAEACEQHGLSVEELDGWINSYRKYGLDGLRARHPRVRAA